MREPWEMRQVEGRHRKFETVVPIGSDANPAYRSTQNGCMPDAPWASMAPSYIQDAHPSILQLGSTHTYGRFNASRVLNRQG